MVLRPKDEVLRTSRIGGPQARYRTIRESLTEAVGAPFRRLSSVVRGQSSAVSNETLWALKDVSFEVQRGEVMGIPSLRQALGTTFQGRSAQYKRQPFDGAQDKAQYKHAGDGGWRGEDGRGEWKAVERENENMERGVA